MVTLPQLMRVLDGWTTLADSAQRLHVSVADLWNPLVERPSQGLVRHAERVYAVKVHRHALSADGLWLAPPALADSACPRCRLHEPYTPSPWAIWDSLHAYPDAETARQAIMDYVLTHAGWHHAQTLARAWNIPVSANLVRGTDNKSLGALLYELRHDQRFGMHRHLHIVGEYERVETWVTAQGTEARCPACDRDNSPAHCPRCGARIASASDLIDSVQGLHGSRQLSLWHLDPPGCTACLPTGW